MTKKKHQNSYNCRHNIHKKCRGWASTDPTYRYCGIIEECGCDCHECGEIGKN